MNPKLKRGEFVLGPVKTMPVPSVTLMPSIPITHRRNIRQHLPEQAAIEVSEEAAGRFRVIADQYNMEVHIRQLTREQVQELDGDNVTLGVQHVMAADQNHAQKVIVSLEHRRGTFKSAIALNEEGPDSPRSILESLLVNFKTQDLVDWISANA